jgi:hypothetical protein
MIEHILSQLVRDNLLHDKIFKTKVSAGYDKPIFKRSLENKRYAAGHTIHVKKKQQLLDQQKLKI